MMSRHSSKPLSKSLFIGAFILAIVAFVSVFAYQKAQPLLMGISPLLEKPNATLINNTAEPPNFPLQVPEGLELTVFATDRSGPRDIEFTPGGTLLVSEPAQGRVVALTDTDNNGQADPARNVIEGLRKPHGLAFGPNNTLYVAAENSVSAYDWNEDSQTATLRKKITDLPTGGRHTSRTLVVRPSDGHLLVSLGSTCDVCFEKHPWISTVLEIDPTGNGEPTVFATGLRNAVFLTLRPQTEELWGTEMGRDFLGDNLPPDEINHIEDGKDYGWPICYGQRVYDAKFGKKSAQDCAATQPAAFDLPAHNAPLGLAFIQSAQFPEEWQGDLLVAFHGSWNSTVPVGYKLARLDFVEGKPAAIHDFITGWQTDRTIHGRPVDVSFAPDGTLFISDDRLGVIYAVRAVKNQD